MEDQRNIPEREDSPVEPAIQRSPPTVTFVDKGPGNGMAYPPSRRANVPNVARDEDRPATSDRCALSCAVDALLSPCSTHMLVLSAVSFFGAGMAWVAVFSGARENVVIMSWAASCFMVGAVTGGSAAWLAHGLLEQSVMRWAVLVFSLCSATHTFAGLMLVSVAILVLDNGGHMGIGGQRSAGAYALVLCVTGVAMAIVVRWRYGGRWIVYYS